MIKRFFRLMLFLLSPTLNNQAQPTDQLFFIAAKYVLQFNFLFHTLIRILHIFRHRFSPATIPKTLNR